MKRGVKYPISWFRRSKPTYPWWMIVPVAGEAAWEDIILVEAPNV